MIKFCLARKCRIVCLLTVFVASLLCLAACKNKDQQAQGETAAHVHTYVEQFSYDTENHWRQATCEHKEEKGDLGAHQYGGDQKCTVCGYQSVTFHVKTDAEGQKYVRTQPIYDMLKIGFAYGGNADNVQWAQAQKHNIESYTISNGQITVKVSAVSGNIKHTKEITVPMEESPIDVETFFAQKAGDTYMLNGVVAGFSTTSTNNEVVLADKQTGKLVSVIKMGAGRLLYGGYSLPGIAIGDEITIPVSLVKEKQASNSANSAKIYAEYKGGIDYHTAVVSKNNQVKFADAEVVIDSQADLVAFLSAGSRENNHYKIVKFKGKMNFVMDSSYDNHNFWLGTKSATAVTDIQIDNITPCFNGPSIYYTIGSDFSELVLGKPYQAAVNYTNPHSAEVEITAVFLGGNTKFAQFLILDQSWVTK